MRKLRTLLRRPRWLSRPLGVLVAVVVGLGGLGGAAGALFGELGAAGSMHEGRGQLDQGRHGDAHIGHLGDGFDGDGDGGLPGQGGSR
jgi:hypothetical protein